MPAIIVGSLLGGVLVVLLLILSAVLGAIVCIKTGTYMYSILLIDMHSPASFHDPASLGLMVILLMKCIHMIR